MCRQVVSRITDCISAKLPAWLSVVHTLLARPSLDKLTLVAIEILLQAHAHFNIPVEQVGAPR